MSYIVVDVEADGPSPSTGSIVCFGAVLVSDMSKTFYGKCKPRHDFWVPEALAVSGFSREEHEEFPEPMETFLAFEKWVKEVSQGSPVLISDNNGFDWQFINDYFHFYLGRNPFGHSCRRIGDLYCGLVKHAGKNRDWKRKYRKTKHDHNPVNDAMGNAEAIRAFQEKLNLKIHL